MTRKTVFIAVFGLLCFFTVTQASEPKNTIAIMDLETIIKAPPIEKREVVGKKDIEKLQCEDFPQLLSKVGVDISSYGSYGMQSSASIRGFSGSLVKVVIDGVLVNSEQNGSFDFTSIQVNDIERLEVVKGGFIEDACVDGAVGGIIYITTKKQSISHSLNLGYSCKTFFSKDSPLDGGSFFVGYSGYLGNSLFLKIFQNVAYYKNAFPFQTWKKTVALRDRSSVKDAHTTVQLLKYFNNGGQLRCGNTFYLGLKEIPGPETNVTLSHQNDFNNCLSLSFFQPGLWDDFLFKTNLSWRSSNQFYDDGAKKSTHLLTSFNSSASLLWQKYSFFTQSVGYSLSYAYLDSSDCSKRGRLSGFVKTNDKFSFFDEKLVFTMPLSFTFCQKNYAFTPKFGISSRFLSCLLYVQAYRLYEFPTLNQLYWNESDFAAGNPDLKPENGWGGEIGFDARFFSFDFSLNAFSTWYQDKIKWQPVNGKWIPVNLARAFYAGGSVNVKRELFNCLILSCKYEYLFNRLLSDGLSFADNKRIMYTPEHLIDIMLMYTSSVIDVIFSAHYSSERYTSNDNLYTIDSYWLLDAAFNFHVFSNPALCPYVKLNNILDTSYVLSDGYPMPGISLSCGIKLSVDL